MGKNAAAIRNEFHARLGQVARELAKELYPNGMPRGTKFSELEAVAVGILKVGGIFVHKSERGHSEENLTPELEASHAISTTPS